MSQWDSWVERQIREATQRGEFDNLPGSGKPLDLSDADDPDWWIKRYVAREGLDMSQLTHPTLALRREAAGYPDSLADVPNEESVREIIRDYNLRVIEDRRRPAAGRTMPPVAPRLDPDEMVAGWRTLRQTGDNAHRTAPVPTEPTLTDPSVTSSKSVAKATRWRLWWHRRLRRPVEPDE
ncbi:MAG: DUF1992 domain-containing protein [Dermatophilaceae bacterium]